MVEPNVVCKCRQGLRSVTTSHSAIQTRQVLLSRIQRRWLSLLKDYLESPNL